MKSLGCSHESAAVQAQPSWHGRWGRRWGGDLPKLGRGARYPKQEHSGRTAKTLFSSGFLLHFPLSFGPPPSRVPAPASQALPTQPRNLGSGMVLQAQGAGTVTTAPAPWCTVPAGSTGKYCSFWIPSDGRRGLPGVHQALPACPEENSWGCAWPPPLFPLAPKSPQASHSSFPKRNVLELMGHKGTDNSQHPFPGRKNDFLEK